ncbi:MAG: holo-ACP synthase [Clostridiales bacterium]|nr:holo-ACP synthase [Clostridiales bacterium]
MISGIGIDIIEVARVQRLGSKSPRFLERVFTTREIAYCSKKKNEYQHFAARFAAKEAFFKALGKRIPWKDVELVNLPSGKPTLKVRAKRRWPFGRAHVSVSHLTEYALAVVLLEK